MYSLKLDLLFPTLDRAKAIARKLNGPHRTHANILADPRELHRIRAELQLAREEMKTRMMLHRLRIM